MRTTNDCCAGSSCGNGSLSPTVTKRVVAVANSRLKIPRTGSCTVSTSATRRSRSIVRFCTWQLVQRSLFIRSRPARVRLLPAPVPGLK